MVSLVIPAFNEQKTIKDTVCKAYAFLRKNFDDFEIIVVDDGSRDNTAKELIGTEAYVIGLPQNSGKGAAVRNGILHSSGDFVFFTDADLPYSLEFIKEGIDLMSGGCDIVCGSRKGHYPIRRRILSTTYNRIAQRVLRTEIDDLQCGIKGFTREAARRIFSLCRIDGFAFDAEALFLARHMGFEIKMIDASLSHRVQSKVSLLGDGLEMFADILKIRNSFEAGEYNFSKLYQG